jgi:uncharacterized protein YndB with AHSA1/START domain
MPRSDTASRFIRVLPADVYDALIDPEALVMWLPPGKMTGRFERFDARPGGFQRLVSSYPNAEGGKTTADSDVVEARFADLVDGLRVVQEVDFISDDPAFRGTMTMTWDLGSADNGTHVRVTTEKRPGRGLARRSPHRDELNPAAARQLPRPVADCMAQSR